MGPADENAPAAKVREPVCTLPRMMVSRVAPLRKLRLPAFGRALLDLRRRGRVPDPPEVFVELDSWKCRFVHSLTARARHGKTAVTTNLIVADTSFALFGGDSVVRRA